MPGWACDEKIYMPDQHFFIYLIIHIFSMKDKTVQVNLVPVNRVNAI